MAPCLINFFKKSILTIFFHYMLWISQLDLVCWWYSVGKGFFWLCALILTLLYDRLWNGAGGLDSKSWRLVVAKVPSTYKVGALIVKTKMIHLILIPLIKME